MKKSTTLSPNIFQVDAFSSTPFSGNPAAVCLFPDRQDTAWMQQFAAQMNLSETAFINKNGNNFDLRWFTPTKEVDLCGHATLATAHLLWEQNILPPDQPALFHTRSGLLTVKKAMDVIEMDFPSIPIIKTECPQGLAEALSVKPEFVGKNSLDYLLQVASEDTILNLAPDMTKLCHVPMRGVMVTAQAQDKDYDFVSRFFAPAYGIDEDPVTGSAHCALGPYWGEQLGKKNLTGFQASARGGLVKIKLAGDRVLLGGSAVTVFAGRINKSVYGVAKQG
ncbi:MAG: PhzF family phenazine biosynthesis protein [Magnetococcales bacterium]|nr:PhzF family phenazine biosynthesis protein [Magnetococcales bacterium]